MLWEPKFLEIRHDRQDFILRQVSDGVGDSGRGQITKQGRQLAPLGFWDIGTNRKVDGSPIGRRVHGAECFQHLKDQAIAFPRLELAGKRIGVEQLDERHDILAQFAAYELVLKFYRNIPEPQVFGNCLTQSEVHHKGVLATEQAIAGLVRLSEDVWIRGAGIQADKAPPELQYSLGFFDRRKGAQVHRNQDKFLDRL